MRAATLSSKFVPARVVASEALTTALPHSLKRYLYATAAATGAAIMVVEILGAKLLSPYLGTSHFVWTAQIAVTLVALACGYYVGGRLADRAQSLKWLYWGILTAAVYLGITVLICEHVAYWCLDFSLRVGSLLASSILFFIPLSLLAMTVPFVVRMLTSSLEGVGGNVGRLTSISTLGSLVGTILIGYFLIPYLPNSVTMYVTSLVLLLSALGYFALFQRSSVPSAMVVAVFFAGCGVCLPYQLAPKYSWMNRLFTRNSHFGQLTILERREDGCRFLLDDNLVQNTFDPTRRQSVSHFTYMLSGLARVYCASIRDVLCIGLGAGIVPMDFARGGAQVDVVEINPAMAQVASQYFDAELERIHLTFDDGRHYLNRCAKKYDTVVLDVFLGDSSPSHLLTREAFAGMRRVMRPGGVLVINVFAQLGQDHDFFAGSLRKTLQAVFTSVRMHSSGRGEMFFVAGDRQPMNFIRPPNVEQVHPQVRRYAEAAFYNVVEAPEDAGRILTDDYNPAEFFDAKNREEYRRNMAFAVKGM